MDDPQKLAIDAYLKELTELAARRAEVEHRAARVEKAVRAMIDLIDGEPEYESYLERFDDVVRPAGLTSAISGVLQASNGKPVTPTEVRDYVRSMLIGHSNPVASVHTILKRLVKTGDFEPTEKEGKPAYRWIAPGEQMERDIQRRAGEVIQPLSRLRRATLGQRIADVPTMPSSPMPKPPKDK